MFKNLTSFATVRTTKQAIGFFIAYSLVAMLIGALAAMIFSHVNSTVAPQSFSEGFDEGRKFGTRWGVICVLPLILFLNVAITVKKKLGFGYYALSLVSLVLTLIGGACLGLIATAFMTTRPLKRTGGDEINTEVENQPSQNFSQSTD